MHKYWGYFLMEYKRTRFYWQGTVVRLLLILLRMALPYTVFVALYRRGQIDLSTVNAMLWAVTISQIMNACDLRFFRKIKDEVRSGDIAIRLADPANYVLGKIASGFGYFVPHYVLYSLIFVPILVIFFPTHANGLLLIVFSISAFAISTLVSIILGLISFVVEENDGINLLVSKLYFIFGNQIIPVALMPLAVARFAQFTPFYLGLAAPIEVAAGRMNWVLAAGLSAVYIVLFWLIAQWLLKVLQRRLVLNG